MPEFFKRDSVQCKIFKRDFLTFHRAWSLDSKDNTLFTRGLTVHIFSRFITFAVVKNETHAKGWTLEETGDRYYRLLINPIKKIYFIGRYALGIYTG